MSLPLVRFRHGHSFPRLGVLRGDSIVDLSAAGVDRLSRWLEGPTPVQAIEALSSLALPRIPVAEVQLLAPIDEQEVWAAGVTYLRSKKARMEESDFSASAYDRVYEAPRPELFFKALPQKVSGPGGPVGIRRDARWNVPEPELALYFNSRAEWMGCSIGNDMSSRDIEGENLLYLPQAKTYRHSCALGPVLLLGTTEEEARAWNIDISIQRGSKEVFRGQTSVGQIKRRFQELADYLFRSQEFPNGVVLLTGTGVVPPDDFTLQEKDFVRIQIGPIGTLENPVCIV